MANRYARFAAASLVVLFLAMAHSGHATTTIDFTLEDLVRFSHACVRVRIVPEESMSKASPHFSIKRTEWGTAQHHAIEVEEVIFGDLPSSQYTLVLPGELDGTPALERGETYVLFLNFDNRVEPIIGGRWATYLLDDDETLTVERRPLDLTAGRPRPASSRTATSQSKLGVSYRDFREAIIATRAALLSRGFVPLQRRTR